MARTDEAILRHHRQPLVRLIERARGRSDYACPTCGHSYHFYDEALECAWAHRLARNRRSITTEEEDR